MSMEDPHHLAVERDFGGDDVVGVPWDAGKDQEKRKAFHGNRLPRYLSAQQGVTGNRPATERAYRTKAESVNLSGVRSQETEVGSQKPRKSEVRKTPL